MNTRTAAAPTTRSFRTAGSIGLVLIIIQVVSAASGCSGLCRRDRSQTTGMFEDGAEVQAIEEPEIHHIKGGPTVALLSHDESPVTAVQLWSPRGSSDVPTGADGTAELCAELFCARQPTPDGIDLTTWASHDMTVCEFSAPRGLGEALISHLGRLLHRRGESSKTGLIEQRCHLAEERWSRSRIDPTRILTETLFRSAFGAEHPYGRPVLASPNCEELGTEQLLSHCAHWFNGNDLVVTAAGDLTLRQVTSAFAHLRNEERAPVERPQPLDRAKNSDILVTTTNVERGQVALGFALTSTNARERAEAHLLLRLLSSRNNARPLDADVEYSRAKGRRSGYIFTGQLGGLMVIMEPTRPESAIETVTALAEDALSLSIVPPGESSVAAARLDALRRHQRARYGSPQLARALGFDLVVGGNAHLSADVRRAISQASPSDLADTAKSIFVKERLSVSVLLPEHLKSIPSRAPTTADEAGASRVDVDQLGSIIGEKLQRLFSAGTAPSWNEHTGEVTSIRAPHGQLLIVRRERYSSLVSIRAAYPLQGQHIDYTPGALISLRDAMSSATAQVASARPSALSLNVRRQASALSVEGVFLRGNALEGLGLVIGALNRPPTSQYAECGMEGTPSIDPTLDPLGVGRLAIRKAFYPDQPLLHESEELVRRNSSANASDLQRLHSSIVGSGQLVVSVVGPVEPADVYRAFITSIADISTEAGDDDGQIAEHRATPPATSRREMRHSVESPLTTLWFAFPILGISASERDVLEVLATLLGSRGGQPWRRWVDTGLASEVGVDTWLQGDAGHLAVFVTTTPQNEVNVRTGLSAILDLASSPVTDFEIEQARQIAAGRVARTLSSATARAEALERSHFAGLSPSIILESPSRILEVGANDVHQLARRLLVVERLLTVVVGADTNPELEPDTQ